MGIADKRTLILSSCFLLIVFEVQIWVMITVSQNCIANDSDLWRRTIARLFRAGRWSGCSPCLPFGETRGSNCYSTSVERQNDSWAKMLRIRLSEILRTFMSISTQYYITYGVSRRDRICLLLCWANCFPMNGEPQFWRTQMEKRRFAIDMWKTRLFSSCLLRTSLGQKDNNKITKNKK